MKKSFLAILLALVLCLGMCSFVACDDKKDPPKPGPSGGDANVPVAEGKVTLYFTLADDSAAMPEYASVFYAGGQLWVDDAWPTGTAAPEFKNVEGTKLYYIQLEYDANAKQANEYQLVMGYNAKSGLPADKQGLQWVDAYKSDTCAAPGGTSNPSFEYDGTSQKINLGTHKWSTEIAKPERIEKVDLRVTFKTALNENAEVYFMGGFNGWDVTKAKATANTDRTVYSLEVKDQLCTSYDYKVIVIENSEDVNKTVGEGAAAKEVDIWHWTSKTNPEKSAGIFVSNAGGNISMSISKTDELLGYIDLCNTVSELDKDDPTVKKIGLDLTKVVEKDTTEVDADKNPVAPLKIRNLYLGANVTFTVQFSAALKDTQHVFLAGGMNGWTGKEMTKGENNTYSIEIEGLMAGEYEFKVVVVDIAADAEVKFDWGGVNFGVDDGKGNIGNAKVTVAASDAGIPGDPVTLPLFAEALVMPEPAPETPETPAA